MHSIFALGVLAGAAFALPLNEGNAVQVDLAFGTQQTAVAIFRRNEVVSEEGYCPQPPCREDDGPLVIELPPSTRTVTEYPCQNPPCYRDQYQRKTTETETKTKTKVKTQVQPTTTTRTETVTTPTTTTKKRTKTTTSSTTEESTETETVTQSTTSTTTTTSLSTTTTTTKKTASPYSQMMVSAMPVAAPYYAQQPAVAYMDPPRNARRDVEESEGWCPYEEDCYNDREIIAVQPEAVYTKTACPGPYCPEREYVTKTEKKTKTKTKSTTVTEEKERIVTAERTKTETTKRRKTVTSTTTSKSTKTKYLTQTTPTTTVKTETVTSTTTTKKSKTNYMAMAAPSHNPCAYPCEQRQLPPALIEGFNLTVQASNVSFPNNCNPCPSAYAYHQQAAPCPCPQPCAAPPCPCPQPCPATFVPMNPPAEGATAPDPVIQRRQNTTGEAAPASTVITAINVIQPAGARLTNNTNNATAAGLQKRQATTTVTAGGTTQITAINIVEPCAGQQNVNATSSTTSTVAVVEPIQRRQTTTATPSSNQITAINIIEACPGTNNTANGTMIDAVSNFNGVVCLEEGA